MQTEFPPTERTNITQDELNDPDTELASALARFRANSRVSRITISVGPDACTIAREIQGTYQKALTPRVPVESCSRPGGCTCRYLPVLKDIFP